MSSRWKATVKKTGAKSSQSMFMAAIRPFCMLPLTIFTVLAILTLYAHSMGGSVDRQNPLDAAVLHLAKGIAVEPSVRIKPPSETPVQQNGSEFYACGIHSATTKNTTSRIDLLNYNRCVAQAMILAMNAKEDDAISSLVARLHAESVHHDLDEFVRIPLERAMSEFITEKSWVENDPSNIFFEPKEYCDLSQSRFHAGWASNVVIADKVLSGAIPVSNVGTYPFDQLAFTKDKFIAGYSGIKIDDMTFEFVPVWPGSKPHLVSTDDFQKGMEANSGAPPNAFGLRMKPTKRERYANVWSYPMAAAVIGGKVKGQQHVEVFTASIPGGYIELRCHQMDGVPKSIDLDERTFEKLLQRCREIQPTTTAVNLKQLLQNNSATSSDAYIYLEDQNPERSLIITDKKPITFTGVEPDEATLPVVRKSHSSSAFWTPSTGFGNLLGRLST